MGLKSQIGPFGDSKENKALLRINPEQTQASRLVSRRVDLQIWV